MNCPSLPRQLLLRWVCAIGEHVGKLRFAESSDKLHVTMAISTKDKVRAHRQRLRDQGLRPIQIWVPDVRSSEFAAEAHRQSLAVANSPHEHDDQEFIDAISDLNAG